MFDTLKEAAQSGWAQSWGLIIGNFGSKRITMCHFGWLLVRARNVLSGGLSSGWSQFLKEGIADEEGYKDAIKSIAKERGISIDDMIKKEGSFEATLKSGWLTSDIMTIALKKLVDKTKDLSDEQLVEIGYDRRFNGELRPI